MTYKEAVEVKLGLSGRMAANFLKADRERAELIIEAAFPGMKLGKYRKDKGVKKTINTEYKKRGE
jgi:hypothetical protein